jgi:hypothetical protein
MTGWLAGVFLAGVISGFAGCSTPQPAPAAEPPRRARVAVSPAMPDPKLTPGAVDRALTKAKLCDPSFHTGDVRRVSASTKKRVYAEYGREPHKPACCEVDHLISLELGGSDAIANLWPQPYEPRPGAHEKDLVENWLHREVCAGRISLDQAQREIAADWFAVYRRMQQGER